MKSKCAIHPDCPIPCARCEAATEIRQIHGRYNTIERTFPPGHPAADFAHDLAQFLDDHKAWWDRLLH